MIKVIKTCDKCGKSQVDGAPLKEGQQRTIFVEMKVMADRHMVGGGLWCFECAESLCRYPFYKQPKPEVIPTEAENFMAILETMINQSVESAVEHELDARK